MTMMTFLLSSPPNLQNNRSKYCSIYLIYRFYTSPVYFYKINGVASLMVRLYKFPLETTL